MSVTKYLKKCKCGGSAVMYDCQGFSWELIRHKIACDRCDAETSAYVDKAEAEKAWNDLNSKSDFDYKPDPCPFCRGVVSIIVCDDEGNIHEDEYEKHPWSGLRYMLKHDTTDVPMHKSCPIATFEDEAIGTQIYNSRKEAAESWNNRF